MSLQAIDPTCRRALVFTPMEIDRRVLVEAAVLAEELGYEAVAVPEGWGFDASVVLAEIALRTERIRLVSGIFSIWGRSAATLAMTAATLDDLSGGRFTLGLGASTPVLAERFHDTAFDRPAAKLRQVATSVRSLLDGDRAVTTNGSGPGLALGRSPAGRVPLYVAGLGPKVVRVATDLADGLVTAMVPRSHLGAFRDQGQGSPGTGPELICGPMAGVFGAAAAGSRQAAEQMIGWYLTGMGPLYGNYAAASGFAGEVAALRAANPKPRPGNVAWPAVADPILEELAVFGSPDEIAGQLAEWDGVADVVAVGVGPAPLESVTTMVRMAAP